MQRLLSLVILLFCGVSFVHGSVQMPSFFGDNAVLQTRSNYGTRPFLNGFSNPGEKVAISSTCDGSYSVTTDSTGAWSVMLNPVSASSKKCDITVQGEDGPSITAHNVMWGDVFFCSGESNMEFPLSLTTNATADIASASNYPNFRLFTVAHKYADTEQTDVKGKWIISTPDTIANFSAVCFLTAKAVAEGHGAKDWPVGLVLATWRDTRIEAWMSTHALSQCPGQMPAGPGNPQNTASALWNGMISPFFKLSIRAAFWYQGETNAAQGDSAERYACLLNALIGSWRDTMPIGNYGFNIVQLAPGISPMIDSRKKSTKNISKIRLGQADVLPHVSGKTDVAGMAVAIDLGGKSDWGWECPPNKEKVSNRLAKSALHATYALQPALGESTFYSGPFPISISIVGTVATISFKEGSANGLLLTDAPACVQCCHGSTPFQVNTGTAQWQDVLGVVNKNTIIFSSVPTNTKQLRYAWMDYVDCLLYNDQVIPMSPFLLPVTSKKIDTSTTTVRRPTENMPLSPPMGFNSWNYYHCNIDEVTVKKIADTFVTNGMAAVGYQYVNIDDCWQVQRRKDGTIIEDPTRFPSGMKALTDYVHSKGLKFGLYTARGSGTCQGRPGSLNHELIDAKTYCDWGIDYIKIDSCRGAQDANTSWSRFHQGLTDCLNRTGRYIVQSVESCHDPTGCGKWIPKVANLWRTGGDIQATWKSILININRNNVMAPVASPGHFNDPDMMQVGNVGMSLIEQKSHFSLWCIAGAPILAGTDIVHASSDTIAIYSAPEVIAVDQDLGKDGKIQGVKVATISIELKNVSAGVIVAKCDNSALQQWEITPDGKIIHKSTGRFLDVLGCKPAPPSGGGSLGVVVGDDPICQGRNQHFSINSGNHTITSAVDGSCLDVNHGRIGNPVEIHFCNGGKNEQWKVNGSLIMPYTPEESCLTVSEGTGKGEIWMKILADGTRAVLLLNLEETDGKMTANFTTIGMTSGTKAKVRDLWAQKDLGTFTGDFTADVKGHGVVMVKMTVL